MTVYYNYRHYNFLNGRWLARDPLEEFGGYNLLKYDSEVNDFDFLGLKVSWSSRDMSFFPLGNHHFITFTYKCHMDAPSFVRDSLKTITCDDNVFCPIYVATIGLKIGKNGLIESYRNTTDDLTAIKESYCKETKWYKSDFDYQHHDVDTRNEEDLVNRLIEGLKNFDTKIDKDPQRYNLWDLNCATWVNGLMA